uniref:hypothetical protein n=1 Tax=Thermococcus sp. TaxID=35749 RepID=UPI0026211027
LILAFLVGSLLVVGSSGNFRGYASTRDVSFQVVPHGEEYIGFDCKDGYSSVVLLRPNSEADFGVINITNSLPEGKIVAIALGPNYTGLPSGLEVSIETDDGDPVSLDAGERYTFAGHASTGNVGAGEYTIPIELYATWDGGGASVSTCPLKLIVEEGPKIDKVLLSGNTSGIPLKTYQEWVFQVVVTNPGSEDIEITVTDTIPAEFNVSLSRTGSSAGEYAFQPANWHGVGSCGGCHGSATKMEWNVTVPAGGSEHINVTIFTRINGGGQQEFTCCGDYPLNNGARIVGYDIVSNSIWVSTACSGGGEP